MTEAEELEYLRLKKKKAQTSGVSYGESLLRGGAQGLLMDWADEAEAGVRAAIDPEKEYSDVLPEVREKYKAAEAANPITYNVGQFGTALAAPGLGSIKAAGLAGKIGLGALGGAVTGLGSADEDKLSTEAGLKAGIGGVLGGAAGGVFGALGNKLASKKAASEAAQELSTEINPAAIQPDDISNLTKIHNESLLNPQLRPDAAEIEKAWRSYGVEAPLYTKTKDKVFQNVASDLIQSPTMAGRSERKAIAPVFKGLDEYGEKIQSQAGGISRADAGSLAKSKLSEAFKRDLEPAEKIYNEIESQFRGVPIRKQAINRALNRMQREIGDNDTSGKSKAMIENMRSFLANKDDVDGIRQIRTSLGQSYDFSSLTGNEKRILSEMNRVLTRERNRSILGNYFKEGPAELVNESRAAAEELLGRLKEADSIYSSTIKKYGSVVPETFGSSAQGIRSYLTDQRKPLEDYVSELFDKGDIRQLENLKNAAPDVFEVLRKRALGEIVHSAKNKATNEVPTRNIISGLGKIEDAALRKHILGNELAQGFDSARTIYSSLPEKFNPSESGTNIKYYSQMLNPKRWGIEGEAAINRGIVRGQAASATSVGNIVDKFSPQQIIIKLQQTPLGGGYAKQLSDALQRGQNSFAATMFLMKQSDPQFREIVDETNQ